MRALSPSRRANAFAQALDEQEFRGTAADQSGGAVPADRPGPGEGEGEAADRATLLSLAEGLASLPRPTMDPDVKAVQRARLIAAMENAFAEGGDGSRVPDQRSGAGGRTRRGAHRASSLGPLSRLRPRTRLSKGLAAGGLSVGVAAGAFTGAAAASTEALPGDTLYGLKLGMEDLRLGMADDDTDRGKVYLGNASTRLNEARRLMERGRSGELDQESLGDIRRALSGMRHDASEGHRLLSRAYERDGEIDSIQSLSSFSESHRGVWTQLRDRLPTQLADVRDEVNSVFDAIDEDVVPLQSLLPPDPAGERPPDGADGRSGPAGEDRTPRPPLWGDGGTDTDQQNDGRPSPSGSRTADDGDGSGGLLGEENLLEPPLGREDNSPPADGDEAPALPEPDLTIPPLLPDLLPGLSLDTDIGDE